MGLTQKLGTIPLAIQTDSSNNVGIGGAANASYKLAVTGATTITGNLGIGGGANERLTITGPSGLAGMARWTDATTGSAFLGFTSGGTAYIHSNSNALSFGANGSNNFAATMTLTSGNVGIGTSSPDFPLTIASASSANTLKLLGRADGGSNLSFTNQAGTSTYGSIEVGASYFFVSAYGSSPYGIYTGGSERMRITSGGYVLIGTTASNNYPLEIEERNGGQQIFLKRSGAYAEMFMGGITSGGTQFFIRSAGSGGVRLDAGATSWASASDERLKNISSHIENAVEKLTTLRAVNFTWKKDEENKNNLGLIAQDIAKVFPEIVSLDEERDEYGVRYTELIPVLVAAIKELSAKVTALENK